MRRISHPLFDQVALLGLSIPVARNVCRRIQLTDLGGVAVPNMGNLCGAHDHAHTSEGDERRGKFRPSTTARAKPDHMMGRRSQTFLETIIGISSDESCQIRLDADNATQRKLSFIMLHAHNLIKRDPLRMTHARIALGVLVIITQKLVCCNSYA